MIFNLPREVEVNGVSRAVRTDFRDILTILLAFSDPELESSEKAYVCLHNFYVDFEKLPPKDYEAAYKAAIEFIDHGMKGNKNKPRTMDWEQDAPIIFPAVNKVAGFEVRSVEYMHWWTFIGYFMEIRDDTAATVFSLRSKKANGEKFEKHEKKFWQQNIDICRLQKKETAEDIAEKERLKKLLGG